MSARIIQLLRNIEWSGGDCAGTPVCPSCSADKYPENGNPQAHKTTCELTAALRELELLQPLTELEALRVENQQLRDASARAFAGVAGAVQKVAPIASKMNAIRACVRLLAGLVGLRIEEAS